MVNNKLENLLLPISLLIFVLFLFIHDRMDKIEIHKSPEIDSLKASVLVDTAAESAFQKIEKVNAMIQEDKERSESVFIERKLIQDSIKIVNKKLEDTYKKAESEKIALEKKYRSQLKNIYEMHQIEVGSIQDTVAAE